MSADDKHIIRQCRKGNRTAQRTLYDRYRTKWFLTCLRYLRNRNDALDVLQNALVAIYSHLNDFDSTRGNFRAWSSKIVVNECLMFLRRKNGIIRFYDRYEAVIDRAPPENPDDIMNAAEIVNLIMGLPEGYRMIFNLYAIEGYTHKEIAGMLDISIGTSKSQLFKARKMLQQNLHDIFEIAHP